MNRIRETFLETSLVARELIASKAIETAWDRPSALDRWAVSGLVGHLARATGSVVAYLDRPEPEEEPISAVAYYAAATGTFDIDSDLHTAIRTRGDETAAAGHADLVVKLDDQIAALTDRLEGESEDRLMRVHLDLVLRLDDYLVTRMVESTVHIDDLAVSVGTPPPDIPPDAIAMAVDCLVAVARHRHGDVTVLRALARRERDDVDALRVL